MLETELQIIELLSQGLTYKEIARQLGCSKKEVKDIYYKTHTRGKFDLLVTAVRQGWLPECPGCGGSGVAQTNPGSP